MAKSQMVWQGLTELMAEIRALPEACAGEAGHLIEAAANGVKVEIAAAYPWLTGDLRKKTQVLPVAKKGLVVGMVVKNTSKHAQAIENGTQARHYVTAKGKTHRLGKMPPQHIFVPRIVRTRRKLTQDLKDMVARNGAVVTGDA